MRPSIHSFWPLLAGLLAGVVAPCGGAQVDWTTGPSATAPSPRSGHALAFDRARGRAVLFGGRDGSGRLLADTWEWNGSSWALRTPAASPAARSGHRLAYDGARRRTVLVGGRDALGVRGDLWQWDGARWTRSPAAGPAPRTGHALAYDRLRREVVLHGGRSGTGLPMADTWTWDGLAWTRRVLVVGPLARDRHAMAWDPVSQGLVLFGGFSSRFLAENDTWSWDGARWRPLQPRNQPPGRSRHAVACDRMRDRVVLFGGEDSGLMNDTWDWDGTDWLHRTPARAPSARHSLAMAYDEVRGQVLLVGGLTVGGVSGEMWQLAAVQPAAVTIFGSGCAGVAGVPGLSAVRLPWLGENLELVLTGLEPSALPLLVLGFSNQWWGARPLPASLGFLGLSGCVAYVSPDGTRVMGAAGGRATLSSPVPNETFLTGFRYYAQAVVVDSAGIAVSNAAEVVLGAK